MTEDTIAGFIILALMTLAFIAGRASRPRNSK
jgi:hypothetical protein